MAVDQDARDLINDLLATLASAADLGTWGTPADYSLIVRQDQPPASGSSQFKVEDLPMAAGDFLYRDSTGDIVTGNVVNLDEETTPSAGDFVLLQKADGTYKKLAAENLVATPAAIAAAVWDAVQASHTDVGTFGEIATEIAAIPTTAMRGTDFAYTGTPPTAIDNADALLKRDWSSVSGEAARSALNALRQARNRVTIVGSTITIYKEDGTTPAWTGTLTTSASAEAITEIAP